MRAASILHGTVQEPASHLPRVLNVRSALDYAIDRMDPQLLQRDFGLAAGDDLPAATDSLWEAETVSVTGDDDAVVRTHTFKYIHSPLIAHNGLPRIPPIHSDR